MPKEKLLTEDDILFIKNNILNLDNYFKQEIINKLPLVVIPIE